RWPTNLRFGDETPQPDDEGRTFAGTGRDVDAATVALGDVLHDRESESRAPFAVAVVVVRAPPEPLEDVVALFVGEPGALVGYRQARPPGLDATADDHGTAGR